MTTVQFIECDGCGLSLHEVTWPRPAITGERSNAMHSGGMPEGEFHWCEECAEWAFRALLERKAKRNGAA